MHEYELGSALVHCTSLRNLSFLRMWFAEDSELLKVLDLERILEDSQVDGEDVVGPYFSVLEYLTAADCYIPASIKTSDLIDMAAGRRAMEGSKMECLWLHDCIPRGLDGTRRSLKC